MGLVWRARMERGVQAMAISPGIEEIISRINGGRAGKRWPL
jgi:hypothetical protein